MKLNRPVVFFDLETTGVDVVNDRIVSISMTKLNTSMQVTEEFYTLVNPGIPIPEGASEVHGITNEDVSDQDKFSFIAPEILKFMEGCDIAGYNIIKYDIPLLLQEFFRVNIKWDYKQHKAIDIMKIYSVMEPRTLTGTYKTFTGKDLENAHDARADVNATIEIFDAMLTKYDLPDDIDTLKYRNEREYLDCTNKFYRDDKTVYFGFGKYKDKSIDEVYLSDSDYFKWIYEKANFHTETKAYAKKLLEYLNNKPVHQ